MLKINLKQLFGLIFVGLIAVSCDDDSNPMASEEHLDAEGFALEIDGTQVYRQLEGTITGDLSVAANGTLELSIHFLDHDGNEIEHEEEEGDEDELSFSIADSSIISVVAEEHDGCDTCLESCVSYVVENYGYTEEAANEWCLSTPDSSYGCADSCEHHELAFELTGLSAGTTTFTLSLMHDGHADYTSLPISVTVNEQ